MVEPILVAKGETEMLLLAQMANRHGLIAGATGTGKTVSLQVLAEGFSRRGVPVFMADVKGDLAGLSQPGGGNAKIAARAQQLGIEFKPQAYPTVFWDVFGEQGHPVRATISEMGPLLLARMLNLNETQEGVLAMVFKIADDNGLLLLDLRDLRAMLQYVGDNAKEFRTKYGNVSAASIGAIQRGLLALEQQGGEKFFGEPALDLEDLMQTDASGLGVINILAADKLMQSAPKIYATMLLWLLSELFERLPEVGDPEKPKLVFFFDEAHLLFEDAPAMLLDKIEQVVRLVRSKGVGVYFVTQNPLDVPDKVLGQLSNRVQHALRAFTPRDQKAVSAAAETFRPNPKLDVERAIQELAVGEALVSLLDEKGTPGIVQRALIVPPASRVGPVTPEERRRIVQGSVIFGHYEKEEDRESAYERLTQRADRKAPAAVTPDTYAPPSAPPAQRGTPEMEAPPQQGGGGFNWGSIGDTVGGVLAGTSGRGRSSYQRQGLVEAMAKSAARSVGSQLGRQIMRGLMGSIMGGRR